MRSVVITFLIIFSTVLALTTAFIEKKSEHGCCKEQTVVHEKTEQVAFSTDITGALGNTVPTNAVAENVAPVPSVSTDVVLTQQENAPEQHEKKPDKLANKEVIQPDLQINVQEKNKRPQKKPVIPAKKTVSVKNNIDSTDLPYKHWTGTYTPSTFVVSVNGQKIDTGGKKDVPIIDDVLEVRYDYDFGPRKGAEVATFAVDDGARELSMTFSWKNDWRISIDKATPQHKEKAEFKG